MNKGLMNIVIKATDNATPNIRRIGRALGGLGKVAGNIKNDLKIAAMGIAGLAAGAVAFAISAIKAAAEDQQSTNTLIATLKARKFNTDKLAGAIDNLIQKGQSLAFTDDEVRSSIEGATRFTKKFAIAQKITAAAMNLSRSTGMSLSDATIAVGKAFQGNGGKLLKTIGINNKHLSGMKAIIAITNKTKGAADAFADSAAGQYSIIGIKLGEMKETIGGPFLGAISKVFKALQPQLDVFAQYIARKMPMIERFADKLANKIIAKLPQLFTRLMEEIPKAMTRIGGFVDKIDSIGKGADKLMGPGGSITLLVTGIGAAFGGLKGAITANLIKNGVDPFTALIVGNITSVIPGALAEVFTKAIVTKAIATFGTSVAAAAAGSSVAAGVAGAVTTAGVAATGAGAAGVGGALATGATAVAGFGAATVAAALALPLAIPLALKALGFGEGSLAVSGMSPDAIAAAQKKAFGTYSNPMDAKYAPNIVVNLGDKKLDLIITDALGRVLADGPR